MQICVHLDRARLYRWHLALIAVLKDAGHDVVVSFGDRPEPLPTSLTAVLDYDRARSGAPPDRFSTPLAEQAFSAVPRYAGGGYDLMMDLASASRVATHPGRVVRPLYDGSYKDYALFQAVLDRRPPSLAIADSETRAVWLVGQPAIEMPWRPSTSIDMITSRVIEGLVRTARRIAEGEHPTHELTEQASSVGRSTIFASATGFTSYRVRRKARRAVEIATSNSPKWHVAWRRLEGSFPVRTTTLNASAFRTLEDEGKAYFADPFLFAHQDVMHVFVEEVPSHTNRGVISHFTLSDDGTPSKRQVVLDTGSHLSYPNVFADGGEIYMLPESSAAGGLDLYRAASFPLVWEKAARLIDEPLHDATPFQHEGRWWIAAGTQTLQSSSWDGLSLYFADSLLGPWHPHALNPVLIDAACARPGGPLWRDSGGILIRPAQDCTDSYGGALTLRRILRLTPEAFAEETAGTLAFGQGSGLQGPHTLSRADGFEIIDLYARPGRLRAGYRG